MITTIRELSERTSFEIADLERYHVTNDTVISIRNDGSVGVEGSDGVLVYSSEVDRQWFIELWKAGLLSTPDPKVIEKLLTEIIDDLGCGLADAGPIDSLCVDAFFEECASYPVTWVRIYDDHGESFNCGMAAIEVLGRYVDSGRTLLVEEVFEILDDFRGLDQEENMKKVSVRNLTPHKIIVLSPDGDSTINVFEPVGIVPRVQLKSEVVFSLLGKIPVTKTTLDTIVDLPPKEEGVYLIVSRVVADFCKDRDDLLVPNDFVRDDRGRIQGCKELCQLCD